MRSNALFSSDRAASSSHCLRPHAPRIAARRERKHITSTAACPYGRRLPECATRAVGSPSRCIRRVCRAPTAIQERLSIAASSSGHGVTAAGRSRTVRRVAGRELSRRGGYGGLGFKFGDPAWQSNAHKKSCERLGKVFQKRRQ